MTLDSSSHVLALDQLERDRTPRLGEGLFDLFSQRFALGAREPTRAIDDYWQWSDG